MERQRERYKYIYIYRERDREREREREFLPNVAVWGLLPAISWENQQKARSGKSWAGVVVGFQLAVLRSGRRS